MLEFELTRHHTGLTLWGDYSSLERLYDFIHDVVAQSVVIEDKESFVLGLAYDVRKAFEGQRNESNREHHTDQCRIYGVEILWPVILVQVGLLRHSMAFIPTNQLDQATMFELEHVIALAVRAAMPVTVDEVLHHMRQIGATPYDHIASVLDSRCCYFIELPATQRLAVLPKLLDTFDPMYTFLSDQGASIRPGIIPPSVFAGSHGEWPDFEW